MNKSQLRLLTAEAADGSIPVGEYRARRRELIDNIVAGTESIERVQSVWAIRENTEPGEDEVTTLNSRHGGISSEPEAPRFSLPFPVLLGAASLFCIAVLVVLLWPADAPEPLALAPPTVPAAEEISPARGLVERFVARRDFAPSAIKNFQTDWDKLTAEQREAARRELWFGSLVRAIRDEVKTQKALAGLASGESAITRARDAFALGEWLGVSDQLPSVDDIASSKPVAVDSQSRITQADNPSEVAPTAAGQTQVESSPTVASPENNTAAPAQVTTSPPSTQPTGRQWLAAQDDSHLTLQIFAVNNLNRVEQLIGAHSALDVHVLATEVAMPRYRVFHGVFRDEAQARQAYSALPADILGASHGAIVKSFSVVREDLRAQPTTAKPTASNDSADTYAVQVFATGKRANAQALIQAFPALNLKLREIAGDAAPYRVVYGQFVSADLARTAASKLPKTLLSRIGTPLPKLISSLGTAARP
ncbi:MAG: septal ring-binding cell division protein DamX [Gammaproteobacteria bacterium]|jgi:septal ring-binding cell division protein DamX